MSKFDPWEFGPLQYIVIALGTFWISYGHTHTVWGWAGNLVLITIGVKLMDVLWEGAKYLKQRNEYMESAAQMDTFVGRLSYAKYLRKTNPDKFEDFIESFDEYERQKLMAALRLEDAVERQRQ